MRLLSVVGGALPVENVVDGYDYIPVDEVEKFIQRVGKVEAVAVGFR